MQKNGTLNDALKYIKLGFAVVPLRPGEKLPAIEDYHNNPIDTETKAQIRWLHHPNDNLGIVLGPKSRICAVDFDTNHGATDEMLKMFPRTVTAKTRLGFHFYFKLPEGISLEKTSVILFPPLDGKAPNQAPAVLYLTKRQFVLPPSVVSVDKSGNPLTPYEYRWHSDSGGDLGFNDCPLAPLPEWCLKGLIETRSPSSPTPQTALPSQRKHPENTRHKFLLDTATRMRKRGEPPEKIEAELHLNNRRNCNPPKEGAELEIRNIVKWVSEHVEPAATLDEAIKEEEYLIPLGHKDTEYYYSSSSNRQIVTLPRSGHNTGNFLDLMPLRYWQDKYGFENKKGQIIVDWVQASSDLQEACRDNGIFNQQRARGVGCWRYKEKLIIHLGDRLYVDGQEASLNALGIKEHTYILSERVDPPNEPPLSVVDCRQLTELCSSLKWKDSSSGMLLAGSMALMRICGALPWRPQIWVTGPKGSGKSTVVDKLFHPIAGTYGLFVQGNTSEAGIRQGLQCASRPVLFDESETSDKKSLARMKGIFELIRQASSESEGRILKGTPDGKGLSFKVNSSFYLSSIRVSLTEEADFSRFAILELDRGDSSKWPDIEKKFDRITNDFGNRLFSRIVGMYPTLLANKKVFEEIIAPQSERRAAQQYGILLAGFACLISDTVITEELARRMVEQLPCIRHVDSKIELADEFECMDHLLSSEVKIAAGDRVERSSFEKELTMARGSSDGGLQLRLFGVDCNAEAVYVAVRHPSLSQMFTNTKWDSMWGNALARLPNAKVTRHRFGTNKKHCVRIPWEAVFPPESQPERSITAD